MDTANYEFSRLLDCVLKNAKKIDNKAFIYFIEILISHYKELGLYIEKDEAENGINNETRG